MDPVLNLYYFSIFGHQWVVRYCTTDHRQFKENQGCFSRRIFITHSEYWLGAGPWLWIVKADFFWCKLNREYHLWALQELFKFFLPFLEACQHESSGRYRREKSDVQGWSRNFSKLNIHWDYPRLNSEENLAHAWSLPIIRAFSKILNNNARALDDRSAS